MSDAPAPTRAEEGREALIARAINRFLANMMPEFHTGEYMASCLIRGPLRPLLSAEARAAQAEAEVARLTAALAEARQSNRELHRRAQKAEGFKQRHRGGFNYVFNRRIEDRRARRAAEASASALRERVATLEAALKSILKPFPAAVGSAEDMLEDWTAAVSRFRATARTALEAPHADN